MVVATAAMIFSADDTCDVGREEGALVADDYPVPNTFTGEMHWIEIDVGKAAAEPTTRSTRTTPPSRDGEAVARRTIGAGRGAGPG